MKDYTPTNWYWIVGGDPSQVYSSAVGTYVPSSDPTYVDWAADGTPPTRVANEDELGDVLANASLRPVNAVVLDKFKGAQASKLTLELVAKVLFNHENRIRAAESKASITAAQFANALKAML
jgi:hypothetical protein